MSPHTHIERKIEKIRAYLSELENFRGVKAEALAADLQKRAALERILYLACDSMISLMEMIVADKNYPRAENYSENVDILFERKQINQGQAEVLHKIVGLRNALSHDYEKLNLKILVDVVSEKLPEFKDVLNSLAGKYGK